MNFRTFVGPLLIGCLALCATSCWTPPGKGAKAESGYRAAAPVIAALEKFRAEHGRFPANLEELVPMYLPDSRTLQVRQAAPQPAHRPEGPNVDRFEYRLQGDTFTLTFEYVGPGMNICTYDSRTGTWTARGYY